MPTENNIWKLAEAYVSDALSETELNKLKDDLAVDPAFATEFHECASLLRSLNASGAQMQFRSMLKDVHKTQATVMKQPRSIPLQAHYWRTAAIAAGIALLTSLTTFWLIQHNNKKIASQYSLLRRDLETYKRSQNQLINNIQDQKKSPVLPARYTGTGFAVTNDGYLVTNYHVIEGADSIYIQNNKGEYYKATIKEVDPVSDIALLKVNDKSFRFGKGEIPYTFATTKRRLGARIYSLGYPQDEVVYNEGYISSKNGYQGDSIQYMLELPANPGQSGAPVIDANGAVIGIVAGKKAETEGTTYAVSSTALLALLNDVSPKIRLPKSSKLNKLTLEQQIEKLEHYTCSIKVYKK